MSKQTQISQDREQSTVLYRILSIPVSLLTILIVYLLKIPNPMMVLIIPIIFFTYSEGYVSGALSGVTAVAYSAYFFFAASADKAAGQKVATIFFAVSAIVLLAGRLKSRVDHSLAELRQAQEGLLLAKEEAERLSQTKSDFLSMMSHEIRTPMNAVIGMTAIAKKSDSMEKIKSCLDRVDDASEHLLGVINDILDMSKIESGKFELSETDFVLEHMLNRLVNVNQVRFEQKHQDFSIVVDPGVPVAIIADQQRLSQVITNLLSNAAKFTPNEGKINLTIKLAEETQDEALLLFEVRDEGIGMTSEQQSRLFQAFEQGDNSITRRFGGTGLGLAISKNIVERMGGSIHVESAPGKGSDFIFSIRVKKGSSTRSSHLSPRVNWQEVRLLAEDSSEYVRQYFHTITRSLGIRCDTASSVEEALRLMEDREYQIVFVGQPAHGTDGLEQVGRIREKHREQILVLMNAGEGDDRLEAEANSLGIRHFIEKPLLPSPLVDCINQCLNECGGQVPQLPDEQDKETDIFLGCRMLLVEDIEINREIMKAILEETGIEITEAENGQAACDLFEQNEGKFDMILMDVHMPVMDGYEATRRIRSREHASGTVSVPVLAMTADVMQEDIRKCLEAGMNGHIGKPVNSAELMLKLKRCMPVRQS